MSYIKDIKQCNNECGIIIATSAGFHRLVPQLNSEIPLVMDSGTK